MVIIYINRENFSLRGETMLVRFSVENFMSYDKKQTFSMIAGRTRNHPEHLYSVENVELLKVSAIYGANASGKSKLVEAMRFACHVINNEIPVSASNQFCKLTAENKHKPSTFDFEFCVNEMFYAYGFSAILSQRTVVAEWLYRLYPDKDKQECIFERVKDKSGSYSLSLNKLYLNLSDEEANSLQVINDFLDKDRVLFLKTINESKKAIGKKNYKCFVVVYNFFSEDIEFIMPDSTIKSLKCYEESDSSFQLFLKAVNSFDTGIVKIREENIEFDELKEKVPEYIYNEICKSLENFQGKSRCYGLIVSGPTGWYRIENDKEDKIIVTTIILNHKNSDFDFAFSEESDGTKRIFDLLRIVIQNKEGGVYIVDELERSLHPKVSERLIQLFIKHTKGKRTQLVFTTHETSIMSQNIFRRDEIWFVEKNEHNASNIYSLDKFSERYDRKLDKAYLEGRYGALPIFAEIEQERGEE